MKHVAHLPGVLTADELQATGEHLASLQLDSGMIPWFPGGHCDPWNHVESAMALDVAGFHDEAERAYDWLVDTQRPDGSWHAYYHSDGSVEDAKLDTNVCAYIATGVWHHLRLTWDRGFADNMWPTVERALEFVLSLRRDDGLAAVGDRSRRPAVGLRAAHRHVEHPARAAMRRPPRRARRRTPPRLDRGRRRDGRRGAHPARRVRAQDAMGDGLVLPGPDRRAHRRSGQGAHGRRLGRRS